ncbi:MAG: TIM barrel protein [Thermoplasmata archaeon]
MIRFGPGGIPLSCKGRTQRDGIEDVHALGLNAMEIQFVRVNLFERYVSDEEVGLRPREIANEFVVDVVRGRKPLSVFLPDIRLEKGDIIRTLNSGVGRDAAEMRELGEIASDLDVKLSIHAPYYMDLLGSDELATRSVEYLHYAGLVAKEIGADIVVTHVGFYHEFSKEEALAKLVQKIKEIRQWFDKTGIRALIGVETSGKRVIFGALDEVLALCKLVPGVIPVLSFPHIHAREGGSLKRKEDFKELFERVRETLNLNQFYTHFSGVEHEGGNELRYTPIKKGDMRFEPLAEYLAEEFPDVTIISDSPLLEHDAMYMKVILERVLLKNEARVVREEVKPAAPIRPPVRPIAPPSKKPAGPPEKPTVKPKKKQARPSPGKPLTAPAKAGRAAPPKKKTGGAIRMPLVKKPASAASPKPGTKPSKKRAGAGGKTPSRASEGGRAGGGVGSRTGGIQSTRKRETVKASSGVKKVSAKKKK